MNINMKEFQNYKSSNNNKILFVLPLDKIEENILSECIYSLSEQEQDVDLLILNSGLDEPSIKNLIGMLESPSVIRSVLKSEPNPNKEQETIKKTGKNKINFIIEETKCVSFNSLFNESFNYANINNYEWFTVFEYDDLFLQNWLKYFNFYSTHRSEFDVFLPLVREMTHGGFAGFLNEASWVDGFSEVAGVFDLNLLLRFNCLNITGSAFKVKSIKNYSEEIDGIYKPMKESIKINYSYEFVLRMIYNDLKFYTIPRLGYDHKINNVVDKVSYFKSKLPLDITQKSIDNGGVSIEEYKFWMDLSKKEYFFDNDRKKSYQTT